MIAQIRLKSIEVQNLNKRYKLNERFIKEVILKILKTLKKPLNTELEVIFLPDAAMRAYNKRYKKADSLTDVLSFKIDRREFGSRASLYEILISSDRAFENSKVFNTEFEDELVLYVIHGILHLFGYDDENLKDRLRMSKKEGEVLGYLCKREDLSKVLMPQ